MSDPLFLPFRVEVCRYDPASERWALVRSSGYPNIEEARELVAALLKSPYCGPAAYRIRISEMDVCEEYEVLMTDET